MQLLQKLAWWLIRNGRQEMDRAEAHQIIGRALPALNLADTGHEEVYRALLLRSGLLREPAEGRVDFLHRTFRDYLGARLAVQEMDFDLLVNHAELDDWEDVVLLALAHARPREAEYILRRLADSGHARGTLLAAAGLRYVAEAKPGVRKRVEDGLLTRIPPATFDAAQELARAGGDLVLGLLPGPEEVDPRTAVHVVHTAVGVGSEAGAPVPVPFPRSPRLRRAAGPRRRLAPVRPGPVRPRDPRPPAAPVGRRRVHGRRPAHAAHTRRLGRRPRPRRVPRRRPDRTDRQRASSSI
ncbi:hypothetical protein LV779_10140 [Streptomyces thinghirensis]|nr:hypothetical protein [Streptomyces thinghirensis]